MFSNFVVFKFPNIYSSCSGNSICALLLSRRRSEFYPRLKARQSLAEITQL